MENSERSDECKVNKECQAVIEELMSVIVWMEEQRI